MDISKKSDPRFLWSSVKIENRDCQEYDGIDAVKPGISIGNRGVVMTMDV